MKKTSKSKSKKYPKLKKYALGLTPNDPLTPVTTTNNPAGNINKIDPNIQRNYPVYQKILLEGEPETYWQGSVKSTPDEFLKLNKSGNITSMPSVKQISKTDWEKNIGTSNMMPDYQRYHKYGGVQLPKYAYGDTPDGLTPMTVPEDPTIKPYYAPAESAAITEQKQQQKANQQSQISSQDAVNIGAAAAKGGMNMYTTQNDPNATSMQKGQSTRDAVYGVGTAVGGAINPALGTAMGLVDSGSKMVRASADKTNSEGQLVNKGGSQVAGAAGAFLDPAGALIELQSDPNATDVEKVAGALTGGYSEMFSGRHQRQVESDAKANIEAQAAAKKSYDEQVAAQQAQQQAYMNQQIQSGINNYYANPDKSQTFAMGGIPQMPNAEVEGNEMITSNTPPQTFGGGGVELASNNPYGTPTYKTNGASHANGGMPISMAPGSIINGKTINPMTGNKFTKDIDAIAKMENKFTKKAESGDKYSKTMANLMLPTLAKRKEYLNELQKHVIANNEQRKSLKNGIMPSRDNEMLEPQGMPEQAEGEMVMARYGAQMPIYDEEAVEYKKGGIHIKPENRGKFTAYKKRTGKTTAEALHSPNAHVRQMANFARNAAKWKHEMGGEQGDGNDYKSYSSDIKNEEAKRNKEMLEKYQQEVFRNSMKDNSPGALRNEEYMAKTLRNYMDLPGSDVQKYYGPNFNNFFSGMHNVRKNIDANRYTYKMGGMQGLPKYDGGGYSDASGSYDSQGNMIAGPMGEILSDSQYRNAINYGDAWNSDKPWGTTTQGQADYFNDVEESRRKNMTAAARQRLTSAPVTSTTPAIAPAITPQSSIGDPSKGYYVNGVWNPYPTYARSTPEGTFNAAGEQTLDAYGRPMMQTFAPIQSIKTDPNNPLIVTNSTNKVQAEKNLQNSFNKDVAPRADGSIPAPDPKDYSNYADYAREAAIFAGQNLGNISDLIRTKGGRKYDRESYGQMTPQMPDYTEAKRAARSEAGAYRRMLPGLTGGNAGATLGMMGQLQGRSQQELAKITEGEQQARTGVYNQFLPLNKQLQMQERADIQANKARSEDIARMATSGIAATIGGAGLDYGMSKSDREKLDLISKAYPDYSYDKKKKGWYHKNTNEKLDPTKVQAATTATK